MPLVPLLTIAPFPPDMVSLRVVAAVWERKAARAVMEAEESTAKLELARRGGAKLQLTSESMRAPTDEIIRGVVAAKPTEELLLSNIAKGNEAGAQRVVNEVTANANSGSAEVARFNPRRLRDAMRAEAEAIVRANDRVTSNIQELDEFEDELVNRDI